MFSARGLMVLPASWLLVICGGLILVARSKAKKLDIFPARGPLLGYTLLAGAVVCLAMLRIHDVFELSSEIEYGYGLFIAIIALTTMLYQAWVITREAQRQDEFERRDKANGRLPTAPPPLPSGIIHPPTRLPPIKGEREHSPVSRIRRSAPPPGRRRY